MALLRAQVTLHKDSLIPRDAAQNVFHFDGESADEQAALSGIQFSLRDFYSKLDELLSGSITDTGTCKVYRLNDPEPRQPIFEFDIPLTLATGSPNLPEEVACCISFEALPVSGMKQSRRRGRLYIGPLATSVSVTSNGEVRPGTTALNTLSTAGAALLANSVGQNTFNWVVYSPTTDTGSVGAVGSFAPVARGWVDNAWDTQRRRGVSAFSRVEF